MRRLLILVILFPAFLCSQPLPTIEEKTKNSIKSEGFIDFYWDENAGKLWMEIAETEREFLYITSLPAGLGSNDIGLDRGLLGSEKIVSFIRTGRKIMLVQPNYEFRALSADLREKKAVEESFARSTIWGFSAEAQTGERYLVDATDFLMRDAMQVVNRLKSQQQGNYSLDKSRSAFYLTRTKNFPFNTEFEVTQSFVTSDTNPGNYVQSVTPSPESITLRLHHSFVQLPDAGYKPRLYDPRSGFISFSYADFSTPVSESLEKRFIIRHRLQKKDPSAARSEALEPIIYYLDNGTPEPIRSALLAGASWWNQAFEAAGYINAFQVRILPDNADPMDVRYNVINWVHRSTRGWSYGASVIDPRTGEIIKGHVTLGSLRVRQDYLIASGLLAPYETGVPADDKMLKMALQRLEQLSAHEVGHTLGLMHNFAGSVSDRASVMDYPHPMVFINSRGQIDLQKAYDNKIGEWDKISIRYGYEDFAAGKSEKDGLEKILREAFQKNLQYLSDQDARRAGGLHPLTHLWDNGSNAVDELKNVIEIRKKALHNFGEKNIRDGMPMALLEDALVPVYFYHRYQLEAATKLVGGMYYAYALRNDGQVVTKPLPIDEQRKALEAIMTCIQPEFLLLPGRIADLVPPRPPGFASTRELFRRRTGLSFDQLSPAESGADLPFSFLFNSERLNRMVQQAASGTGMGISEMVNTILKNTWYAKKSTGTEKLIQLQTEQVLLTYLLSSLINDNNSFLVRGEIKKIVTDLERFITSASKATSDPLYKGHLLFALERMEEPEKEKPTLHKEIPPGAPIGCDF